MKNVLIGKICQASHCTSPYDDTVIHVCGISPLNIKHIIVFSSISEWQGFIDNKDNEQAQKG